MFKSRCPDQIKVYREARPLAGSRDRSKDSIAASVPGLPSAASRLGESHTVSTYPQKLSSAARGRASRLCVADTTGVIGSGLQ